MAASLASLLHKCGEESLAQYCDQRLGSPLPQIPEDLPKSAFGREAEHRLMNSLTSTQCQRLRQDMQRISNLGDASGLQCLSFSAERSRQPVPKKTDRRSAFKQALFYFLNLPDVFKQAECFRFKGRYTEGGRYHDRFVIRGKTLQTLAAPTDAQKSLITEWFRRFVLADCFVGFEIYEFQPYFPFDRTRVFHLIIFWGDDRFGINTFDRHGAGCIFPHQQQMIGFTFNPKVGELCVFGRNLDTEQRLELAKYLAKTLLDIEKVETATPIRYDLNPLITKTPLGFPPKLNIQTVGLTDYSACHAGSQNRTSRGITYPLPMMLSVQNDLEGRGYAAARAMAQDEFRGCRLTCVGIRIELGSSKTFPDGHTITGRITPRSIVLDAPLDIDRFIVLAWVEYLQLDARNAPLLSLVS